MADAYEVQAAEYDAQLALLKAIKQSVEGKAQSASIERLARAYRNVRGGPQPGGDSSASK